MTGLFTDLPNLPRNFGSIYALTIDPRIEIESVSIEHISDLELSIDDSRFSEGGNPTFIGDILQAMKLIGENGRNLKDLTISFPFFPCLISLEFSQLLQDAFSDMFKGLKKFNSLKIVELNIESFNNSSPHLDIFSQDFGAMVTHLIVKTMPFECGDNLSVISNLFPKLQYLYIETATAGSVESGVDWNWDEVRSPKVWLNQVENIFQDSTKIEIYFKPKVNQDCFHLLKMPSQRSVFKTVELNLELFNNSSHHLAIFSQDFGAMVTHLIVQTMPNACGDNLSVISHRFPKLQYLCIADASVGRECGEDWDWNEVRSPKLWSSTIEEIFQDFTKVEIYLKPMDSQHRFQLLKMPFQKIVFKKIPRYQNTLNLSNP